MSARPDKKTKAGAPAKGARIIYFDEGFSTNNPRAQRLVDGLIQGPKWREEVDALVGCSNGPDLVMNLRKKGLRIKCKRIECIDRDGKKTMPGMYYLEDVERRKLLRSFAQRNKAVRKAEAQRAAAAQLELNFEFAGGAPLLISGVQASLGGAGHVA